MAVILSAFLTIIVVGVALFVASNYLLDEGSKALKSDDYSDAHDKLRLSAWLGNSAAQYLLGEMYAYGLGVTESDQDAIYWFRRAALHAEAGNDPASAAELAVSKAYAEGVEVKMDKKESVKWLRLAAAGGSEEADATLERMGLR
jgi:TPR repeat protein